MINLSMEVPVCKAQEWSHLSDLDFVIATAVLRNDTYAKFLRERPADRELILDNAYHEEGIALSVSDLLEAAHRCRADYIISPDKVGDVKFNVDSFHRARAVLWPEFKIAVVMTGDRSLIDITGYAQREQFLVDVREADMLCCTFKEDKRLEWFAESAMAKRWERVHLLGVAELSELGRWAQLPSLVFGKSVSVDTGKPFKWALRGKKLDQLDSLRISAHTTSSGLASEASQKILAVSKEQITPEVEQLFKHNVEVLRWYLQ